jgi:solute carrier family 35 (UDP-galactose transporter), member B1
MTAALNDGTGLRSRAAVGSLVPQASAAVAAGAAAGDAAKAAVWAAAVHVRIARCLARQDVQLVICTIGIYMCYLNYGLLQERIYASEYAGEKFEYSGFLVAVQTAANAAVAAVVLALGRSPWLKKMSTPVSLPSGLVKQTRTAAADAVDDGEAAQQGAGKESRGPEFHASRQWTGMLADYAVVSLSYLCAMLFSFTALNHMSYPMQALGKSCKMIPVMLMGMVIRRRRYRAREFFCVFLVTAGVALFSFKPAAAAKGGGAPTQAATSAMGVALLLASLTMDGVTGPLQERLVARYHPSTHELMLWQNLCSVAWLVVGLAATGEGSRAARFLVRHGADGVARNMGMFALVSAVGQNFIFYTVRNFSALAVTTITTTRKMFTVLLSIFMFEHQMAPRQWAGMLLVFMAIAWEAMAKVQAKGKGEAAAAAAAKRGKSEESKSQ